MSCLEKHGILYGCFHKWHFLCHPSGSIGRHKVMMSKRGDKINYLSFLASSGSLYFVITQHILQYCVVLRFSILKFVHNQMWLWNVKLNMKFVRHICWRVDWKSLNLLSLWQTIDSCLPILSFVHCKSCFFVFCYMCILPHHLENCAYFLCFRHPVKSELWYIVGHTHSYPLRLHK